MKRTITIHQPDFLPWLGFFDRWKQSDLLIILDDVQFLRRGWHHRDRIKTRDGLAWLTIPVQKKGNFEQMINQVKIDNQSDWQRRHLATIRHVYRKAPFFESIFESLHDAYLGKTELLVSFNLRLLEIAAELLGIDTPYILASRYNVSGRKSERLIHLIQQEGGTDYLTGTGSKNYLDVGLFSRAGIRVIWQDFPHPIYPQLYGGFVPNLSVIDFMMNCGKQNVR